MVGILSCSLQSSSSREGYVRVKKRTPTKATERSRHKEFENSSHESVINGPYLLCIHNLESVSSKPDCIQTPPTAIFCVHFSVESYMIIGVCAFDLNLDYCWELKFNTWGTVANWPPSLVGTARGFSTCTGPHYCWIRHEHATKHELPELGLRGKLNSGRDGKDLREL